MSLIESLQRRYASKQMNGAKIPGEKLETILEAIRLAPTSMGIQPFKIIVIENQQLREEIFEKAATGQPQIPNASQLLVFACYKEITTEMLDEYKERIIKTRNLPLEKVNAYRQMMNYLVGAGETYTFNWASRQAYIALGFGLVAAATEKIDSVPIEGFKPAVLDEILGLSKKNLGSVCLMAVGYRNDETDYNAKLPKVRKSKEDLFELIG
jgi:nitroreductase